MQQRGGMTVSLTADYADSLYAAIEGYPVKLPAESDGWLHTAATWHPPPRPKRKRQQNRPSAESCGVDPRSAHELRAHGLERLAGE
jgi:hypothetical protein